MARKTIQMLLPRAADSAPSMKTFAELLDRLSYEPSRNSKLRLITEHFRTMPDPERGWALAAPGKGEELDMRPSSQVAGEQGTPTRVSS